MDQYSSAVWYYIIAFAHINVNGLKMGWAGMADRKRIITLLTRLSQYISPGIICLIGQDFSNDFGNYITQ